SSTFSPSKDTPHVLVSTSRATAPPLLSRTCLRIFPGSCPVPAGKLIVEIASLFQLHLPLGIGRCNSRDHRFPQPWRVSPMARVFRPVDVPGSGNVLCIPWQ